MAQSRDAYEGTDRSGDYGWELNLLGYQSGKTFISYMNQIPAYIKREQANSAAGINVKLEVAPGPMICRGTVVKIIGLDIWGIPQGEMQDEYLKMVFPDKPLDKLRQICIGLRGNIKDLPEPPSTTTSSLNPPTRELIWKWMDQYNNNKPTFSWGMFLTLVGFDGDDPWENGWGIDYGTDSNWSLSANMGPAAALAYQLSKTEIWNEILNQELPPAETINGITTRGNILTGDLSTGADGRNLLEIDQRAVLEQEEGAMDQEFLEGKTASEDPKEREKDRIQRIRFQTQCLLANHVEFLADLNKNQRSKETEAYIKTLMLDGPPYQIINKLTYKKGSEQFAKITVPEASSLVPMIKLSKIYYNEEGKYTGERKIVFDTYTKTEDLLTASSGGRSGVGIKSFEWELNGTNIATVESDITAKMVLYFNNFNDLLENNHEGFKYVDLLVRNTPAKGEDVSIASEEAQANTEPDVSNDQKHYEIKAEVGWAYNNDYILDFENKRTLDKALKSQRLTLFLTLVEHEFGINQDGTFSLTINYRARMDGIFMDKRADVIMGPAEKQAMCVLNDLLDEGKELCDNKKIDDAKALIADAKIKFTFDSSQYIFDNLLDLGKIYYGEIDKETLIQNEDVFKISPNKLKFNLNNKMTAPIREKLISRMAMLAIQDYGADLEEALHQKGIVTADLAGCQETFAGSFMAGAGFVFNSMNQAQEITPGGLLFEGITGRDLSDTINNYFLKPEDDAEGYKASCYEIGVRVAGWNDGKDVVTTESMASDIEKLGFYDAPGASGKLLIPYFFLGDLIDLVADKALGTINAGTESKCNAFINPSRVKNMRVLLGSIALTPLSKASSSGTAKQTIPDVLINIGDIPVSFEYFRDFWARRVTKQQKSTYSLNNFIKDCLKDFALRALGDECFQGERIQDLMIKDATITLPALEGNKEPIRNRIFEQNKGIDRTKMISNRLDMQKINNTQNPLTTATLSSSKIKDTYHYKLFYLQNKSASNMSGNPTEDLRQGIIHLNMGEDRGLLKDISFKRAQFPGLREQRVVEQDQFNPLSHLADVYNVDINMFGNTIFWPGQYLYINPIGFGTKLGKPSVVGSPSRAMGIGGYHLVTQVSSFIENGKFETSVTALWETSGGPGSSRNDRGQSTGVRKCEGSDGILGSKQSEETDIDIPEE